MSIRRMVLAKTSPWNGVASGKCRCDPDDAALRYQLMRLIGTIPTGKPPRCSAALAPNSAGWTHPIPSPASYCARLAPFRPRPEAARKGGADAITGRAPRGIHRQAASAPRISLSAPPTNAGCSPATIRCGSTGFWPACAAKMAPSTATPSVAPIIRAVLTTPAAAPACDFGAAETATESNGPVLKPKPTPIDKRANSIRTMSAARESVERASSPSRPLQPI